jgi:hypothetical protein
MLLIKNLGRHTKLDDIDRDVVWYTLGDLFANNFVFLPAANNCGGILIAVDETFFTISLVDRGGHKVTTKITQVSKLVEWFITTDYGSEGDQDKLQFLGILGGCIFLCQINGCL